MRPNRSDRIVNHAINTVVETLESRMLLAAGPVISMHLINPIDAAASATPLQFVISRAGDTTAALRVSYRVGGSATQANYKEHLSGVATIGAGKTSVTVNVTPIVSAAAQSNKTVTLQVLQPVDSSYAPTAAAQSTGLIQENPGTSFRDLYVGPGQTYTNVSTALAASQDGDFIDVLTTGNYTNDTATIKHNNIDIRGIGDGRANMAWTQPTTSIPNLKGILLSQTGTNNLTVENMMLNGAYITEAQGNNAAGIRAQGTNLIVNDCLFDHDQMGILGGLGDVTIQYSEFNASGVGDGFSHNVYIGYANSLTFQYNYSHDAKVGHTFKSRALTNIIRYNRFSDENSDASYELSTPNGGKDYIIGNVIEQGPLSQNTIIVDYGSEGNLHDGDFLYLVNNTIVNNKDKGLFVRAASLPAGFNLTAKNNIFAGPGTPFTMTPAVAGTAETPVTANNLITTVANAGFVNAAAFNYHLVATSAAVNAGVTPGSSAAKFSLKPLYQYAADAAAVKRPTNKVIDIGAYEYAAGAQGSPTAVPAAKVVRRVPPPSPVSINDLGKPHRRLPPVPYNSGAAGKPGEHQRSGKAPSPTSPRAL